MYVELNNDSTLDAYTEEADCCYKCANVSKCPLMAAVINKVVIVRFEAMEIESCGLFEETKDILND